MDGSQALGFLPTLKFWNRVDTWKQQAPFNALGIALGFGVFAAVSPVLAGLGFVGQSVALAASAFTVVLPLGLFERWLRRVIRRRRSDAWELR
jgi:hypothetical protein